MNGHKKKHVQFSSSSLASWYLRAIQLRLIQPLRHRFLGFPSLYSQLRDIEKAHTISVGYILFAGQKYELLWSPFGTPKKIKNRGRSVLFEGDFFWTEDEC